MSKQIHNIKAYCAPTFWVQIDELKIPVAIPDVSTTEALFDSLTKISKDERSAFTLEDYDHALDMLATMLSCNHNYIKFTAAELRAKNVTIVQILSILTDWVCFIKETAQSKN